MSGITDIHTLLKNMTPELHNGTYVFCTVNSLQNIETAEIISIFKESEGWTVILEKPIADQLNLSYTFHAAWITLTVHSSLEAVGLTAAFSNALAKASISCNIVAAYYHDHIFVDQKHADQAMEILLGLSQT